MHALELGSSRPASVVSEKVAGDGGRGHSAGVGGGTFREKTQARRAPPRSGTATGCGVPGA